MASAPANCKAVSGISRPGLSDVVFLVSCWHSLSRTHPPLHSLLCMSRPAFPGMPYGRGSFQALPGQIHRAAWSPREMLAGAAPYRAAGPWGKKCFLALAGPGFPGCAPRGPQGGLAQGPSLLSDFDKPIPSVPHPHWVGSGASRTSALRLQGDFSPLGRMSKCRCPAHRGGSGLAGLGRAQKSAF